MNNQIIITYVYHSCYTIETDELFIVFDYYKGMLDIPDNKQVIFIASHGHSDHYTSEILKVPDMENKIYILSSDIGKLPSNENVIYIKDDKMSMDVLKSLYNSKNVHFVDPNECSSIKLANGKSFSFKTFGSTDLGISILLYLDGLTIFHAGDLNYWAWPKNDQATDQHEYDIYMNEINKIKNEHIDIAFVPVDPRLEENYFKGADIFIREIHPQVLFPLHFGDNKEITQDFSSTYTYKGTVFRPIYKENQKDLIEIRTR